MRFDNRYSCVIRFMDDVIVDVMPILTLHLCRS
jgi:hypothetical protein